MSTNDYLKNFYNDFDEDGRLVSQSGSVEFLTTMRYVQKYLSHGDRVLEIGAATGRYSHSLARLGYTVDAVELLEHNIEVFRKNTLPSENVSVRQGNALDLSSIASDTYDITLLLGPLYHLYSKEDKLKALSEAIRVTKPGGVVFAAYVISDGCLIDEGFHRGTFDVGEFIKEGMIDGKTFRTKSEPKDLFELVRKEDIDDLMRDFAVTRLHYVATNGCALFFRETLDKMDKKRFDLFLDYHFATCERQDFVGVTNHVIDVFRKD